MTALAPQIVETGRTLPERELSSRKQAVRDLYDRLAPTRDAWIERNAFFHAEDRRCLRFLVSEGLKVLDLGCGTGHLLAALKPAYGVGIDISPATIEVARNNYPSERHAELEFLIGDVEDEAVLRAAGGPFDVILLSDTVGALEDVEATLASLHPLCTRDTRVVITYYSWLWEPILGLARLFGAKMAQTAQNRLMPDDIASLLELADFDVIGRDWRQLMPKRALGLGRLINRTLATLPVVRRLCVRHYLVARSRQRAGYGPLSTSIVIPCRNERGNVAPAIDRLPRFCDDMEIIFAEGHSKDGTLEEIHRVIGERPDLDIKVLTQDGVGKANAVHKAFHHARGDILMILDADLTVPPEALPKFYSALISGKGEFINGTRFVYPKERRAMRFLNVLGNYFFAAIFSWLLNQRLTDTLCGTKVLTKAHYQMIARNRAYFGEFDPFGDYDLIFGAAKLNLKIIEVPIRYAERTYGKTQISRFRHGLLLLQMVAFAYRKMKAF